MSSNNYKVAGKKMTSRFYMSHRQARAESKHFAEFYKGHPDYAKSHRPLSKRLAKKCKHKRWVDAGYGGPEGGCMAGYCKDCGFSMHHTLY